MSSDVHHHATVTTENAREVPVAEFVEGIERISQGVITRQVLEEYLATVMPSTEELRDYEHWFEEKHTRNKIFRNDMIEVMLICWPVGVRTPLHTHNGQLGWMAMIRGRLLVENFRHVGCNAPENQEVVGIDCLAGATEIQMEPLETELVQRGGALNTVDKHHTIHRISNPADWQERAVSLHIYSKPIESCVVFDMEAQRCFRRNLQYDF